MKVNTIRIVLLFLLLANFSIIFMFSNQNSEESGNISSKIARMVEQKTEKAIEEKEESVGRTEKVIRKIAHFSIYTSLGFLLMAFVSTYALTQRKRILVSLSIGVLYAISDEIHQIFVPGRASQITDVMLDSMGILFGILVVLMILKIKQKIKNKNNKLVEKHG
ncbi:MAG: VanZ family protein [Clostridia bacterium]|nr:VanZ family protein [Clostridia bacterium]